MPAYKKFDGKRYRKVMRGFPSKRLASSAAKRLRAKGDVFVRGSPYMSKRFKRKMYGLYVRTK